MPGAGGGGVLDGEDHCPSRQALTGGVGGTGVLVVQRGVWLAVCRVGAGGGAWKSLSGV